jgi:glyoxylase-like metal-dependent hydrolase (beta-lactamase superfamily II)
VIHCLPIPTPFMVGRVNVYLIEDDPLTLVDTGPNSGKTLDELERALEAHGRAVEDLGLIVITHQHMDHQGLAQILVRRSGADVAALDKLVPLLERFAEANEAEDAFAEALMLRHGLSPDVAVALRSVSRAFRGWGSSVEVTRPLTDGGVLELRHRRLQVFHRPGHSSTDTIFWDEERGELIAADHLIKHISSNPLMTRPLDGSDKRPQSLVTYLESMRKTRELPARLVLSGHGEPIDDHVALIDERFELHERRAQKIHALIAAKPRTAHDIAQALWGNIAVTQAFLTLSEVLGHVDLLLNRGQVRELDSDGVSVFEAV